MRRFQRFVAMLLVMALVLPMVPASAFAASGSDYAYTVLEDGTVRIDSYTGSGEHVVIPGQIDGGAVTQLAQEAFAYNSTVDTIVIPESVTFIGNSAFYHCTDLNAIVFRGAAPELEFTVAEGSALEKLFVLKNCEIGAFCALLVNDLGAEGASGVEVLEFDDLTALDAAYNAYVEELSSVNTAPESAAVEAAPESAAAEASPESAAAESESAVETQSTKPVSVRIPAQVNPLYADVLSVVETESANAVTLQSEVTYGTVAEAAAVLREGMKSRAPQVTVHVLSDSEDYEAVFDEVFEASLVHTGKPKEGDYLRWQYQQRGGGVSYYQDESGFHYAFTYDLLYYDTPEQQDAMDTAVADLLDDLDVYEASDFEKVCSIYEWLCTNITYDNVNLENESYVLKYTAYAALVNKTAVCQGYANLFYRLALELGVDSRLIAGIGNGGPHAWNIVKLDGKYYNLDATWDATYVQAGYDCAYFLKCTETFDDHYRNDEYTTDSFNAAYPMGETDYAPAEAVTGGTIGENLNWSFDEGILIISGTGDMAENPEGMPWVQAGHKDSIYAVVIAEGVTSVAAQAFYGHSDLSLVLLPDSMKVIGDGAFSECGCLDTMVMPAGITSVGSGVFAGSSIEGVGFWGDLPEMDENAFAGVTIMAGYDCENPTWTEAARSNYGGTVEWVEDYPPQATGMYGNIRWALYGYGGLDLMGVGAMPEQTSAEGYPWYAYKDRYGNLFVDGISSVGSYAFAGHTALFSVYINGSVTSIGKEAFSGCTGLEEIRFGGEAPVIADDAFTAVVANARYTGNMTTWKSGDKCRNYGGELTWIEEAYMLANGAYGEASWELYSDGRMIIGAESEQPVTVESAASADAYPWAEYASRITNLVVFGMENVPAFAFSGCTALEEVNLEYGVAAVEESAFAGCGALKNILFNYIDAPQIAQNAFSGVTAEAYYIMSYEWPADVLANYGGDLTWKMRPEGMIAAEGEYGDLYWCLTSHGLLCISGSGEMADCTSASDYPWAKYAAKIRQLYVYGITSIGDYAFSGCTALHYAEIDGTVATIGTEAFAGCSSVRNMEFKGEPPVIAEDAFTGIIGGWFMFPYKYRELWTEEVCVGYGGEIEWGYLVSELAAGRLENGLRWRLMENMELYFDLEDETSTGVIGTMETYPWAEYADQVIGIDFSAVTGIGDNAFENFTALENITFAENLTEIGQRAFAGCTALEYIHFSGSAPVIRENAFENVEAVVYYPDSEQLWPEDSRDNYGGNLTWRGQPYEIAGGEYGGIFWSFQSDGVLEFNGHGVMEEKASAEEYPWYAYKDQVLAVRSYSPENIPACAFQGYPNLMEAYIGGNLQTVGSAAFADCEKLKMIRFEYATPVIAADAFLNVTANVIYDDNGFWTEENRLNYGGNLTWRVESHGPSDLYSGTYQETIQWVINTDGLLTISGSGEMLSQTAPEGYPWNAYGNMISVIEIQNIETIGDYAFAGLVNVCQVNIYGNLTAVGGYAFSGCTGLRWVYFYGDAPTIAENAFTDVETEVYYIYGNTTWEAVKDKNYGGTLRWYEQTVQIAGDEFGSLYWNIQNDGCMYIHGQGAMQELAAAEDYPWYEYRQMVISVSFETGVTSVGSNAFEGFENLSYISLEKDIASVGANAFKNCTSVENIYFHGNAPVIEENAFTNVTAYVSHPDSWPAGSIQNYGGNLTWSGYSYMVVSGEYDSIYWEIYSDGTLNICGQGDTMTPQSSADGYPWYPYREQITEVWLSNTASIADYAFAGYTALKNVHTESGFAAIGTGAFSGCSALENVRLGVSDQFSMAEDAFTGVTATVTYPESEDVWPESKRGNYGGELTWEPYSYNIAGDTFAGMEWNLSSNGYLLVNGRDGLAMPDLADAASYPWYDYRDQIRTVHLDNVTTIGDYAFQNYANLHDVNIAVVAVIGDYAFQNCTALVGIHIENTATAIGEYALAGCTALEEVWFAGHAPEIAETAFQDVEASMYYPAGFSSWDAYVGKHFGGKLTWETHAVYIAGEESEEYPLRWSVTSDGRLTIYGEPLVMPEYSEQYAAPWRDHVQWIQYTAIHDVTTIGSYAFADLECMVEANIFTNITSIGNYAFRNCIGLKEINLPESVNYIGSGVFSGCSEGLKIHIFGEAPDFAEDAFAGVTATVEYDSNYASWTEDVMQHYGGNITWVDSMDIARGTCGENLRWVLDKNYVLTISGSGTMTPCTNSSNVPWAEHAPWIREVVLPDSLTSISGFSFYDCSSLTEITIPDSVEEIGNYAFANCQSLETIFIEGDAPAFAESAFSNVTAFVVYPAGDSWTDDILLDYGGTIRWVSDAGKVNGTTGSVYWRISEEDVLTVFGTGRMAAYNDSTPPWFDYAERIQEVVVQEGVTCASHSAFKDLPNLTKVNIAGSVKTIGWSAFENCVSLTDVTIAEGVENIDLYAFAGCTALESVTFPASTVETVIYSIFLGCSNLKELNVAQGCAAYSSVDGVLFSADKTKIHFYPAGRTERVYRIPATVTDIRFNTFYNAVNLTDVYIPTSVTALNAPAFPGCDNLRVHIPSTVTSFIYGVFEDCTNVTVCAHGDSSAANYAATHGLAFEETDHIYDENDLCIYCDKPNVIQGVCGEGLIWTLNTAGILTISGEGTMDSYTTGTAPWYEYRSEISCLILEDGLYNIGEHAFSNLSITGILSIPASVQEIGAFAFYDCSSLSGVLVLPEGLRKVGKYAFSGCGFSGKLVIPDSVTGIDDNGFSALPGITEIELGTGLQMLGSTYTMDSASVFSGCTGVKHVRFNRIDAPGFYANPFVSMKALESVYVPADNFESYETLLNLLPDTVQIQTDGEKLPVTGLYVDRTYSRSAVLVWEPHFCAYDVEMYSVLRDGVEIVRTTECTYVDRMLEENSSYVYTVRAILTGDRLSVPSNAVKATTVSPVLADITTDVVFNDIRRVANGCSTLYFHVPMGSHLEPLEDQVTSVAVYCGDEMGNSFVGFATRSEKHSTDEMAVYIFDWDVALLSDGTYNVHAVVSDVDNTSAELIVTVEVDNTPPSALDLIAVSDYQSIGVSWTFAPEIDVTGYRLYRKTGEDGTFSLLQHLKGRDIQSWNDADVEEEAVYYYYVTSVDVFDRESEPSKIVGATLAVDKVAPKVTKLTPASGNFINGTVNFAVNTEDNVGVTGIELYYSLDAGDSWNLFAKESGGALDTTQLPDGELLVKALAYDEKNNVSDDFIQKYAVDNTGPEQVTGLSFVATSVTLTLSWNDVADEDIARFLVEQKLPDGTYKTVNSNVTALGINIQGLIPATDYIYRVTPFDRLGNAGLPSEDLTATTTADAAGPVIVQILPESGRYSSQIQVSATARDEYCVSSVTLQYSTDNLNWVDIVTKTYTDIQAVRTLSATLPLDKVDEGYLYIRAQAADNEGNVSMDEPFVQHRVDKTAPAAPVEAKAAGGDGYIEISWKSSATDVAGFALYRSESENGTYTLVSELTALNYFDRNVETRKTYYYQVAAKDSAGNWSLRSETVSAASLADGELPEIYSIYPANNKTIGISNSTISVLAADNGGLESILVEYSHDGTAYYTLTELTGIGTYSAIAAGNVPMAEFENGDTVYIRATATDLAGNSCGSNVNTYTIDTAAPVVKAVTAELTAGCVTVTWTGGMEADLAGYRIYRKTPGGSYLVVGERGAVAGQETYSYIDESVAGGETYTYYVSAVDMVNNSSGAESEQVFIPVSSIPRAVLNCDSVMVAKAEYIIDASGSVDNSAIVSYLIDFGDGTEESTAKKVVHAYAEVGTYIITLTVTDDEGNTNITTKSVTVKAGDLVGTAKIRIVDENGAPVPNAPVYFDLGETDQVIKVTDSSGYAMFTAEVGVHSVGCVIPNNEWLPVKKDIVINAGAETAVSMTLVNKPIVEGTFEIERMTLEEIKAAGIDITAPENQYYVEVHLKLRYENVDIETRIIAGPGGTGGGPIYIPNWGGGEGESIDWPDGGGGGRVLYPTVVRPYSFSEEVAVALLDIPIGVSTLKEFFDVKLHVMNNASSEFSMLDNVITLNIPEGLTLMETYNTDSQTVKIAEIKGQTSETIEWILRGDAIGEYYLDADYSGILSQFNEPITTKFKATDPIEVFGMSNLRLVLDVADELDNGTLYYNVSLINEGEIDVYRPSITTTDTIIEMELFDRTNAAKAAYYDFDVMSIEKHKLSTNLSTLPDVLNPGDRLTMHYMHVDQTEYTECRMVLREMLVEYENTYGLQVETMERPVSFFLANLSTSINAYEKAAETFDHNGSLGAYNYIMTDRNFVYWCMANNKYGLDISGDGTEALFEIMSGDWADALGEDDQDQARAMVLKVLDLASMDNAFSGYANVLNWIVLFRSIVDGKLPGKVISEEDAKVLGLALDEIEKNRKWQLYVAINGVAYQASDTVIVDAWMDTIMDITGTPPTAEKEQELRQTLHAIYSSDAFQYVWDEYGIKNDYLDVITDVASDVASDISVYIAAQSDVNTYLFYLEQLINNLGTDPDSVYVKNAAIDIYDVIDSGDIFASVIENTVEEGAWKWIDVTMEAAIKEVPVAAFVMKALEISADIMDLLFDINERQDVANNIRFVDAISDAVKRSVQNWRGRYMNVGSNYSAEKYMMMISLLLDVRAVGESQAAQYGVTYETGMLPLGSQLLFSAAANYSNAPEDVETWYQWRDYVEDKISRCRIQLLKNPVSTDVNEKTAPVVTFDYASGQTAQTFSDEYQYSLNGGKSWISCDGSAIAVSAGMNATELRVQRKNTANTSECMTAVLPIYGPAELEHAEIIVKETAEGYRVENLDNDEQYQVTFSAAELDYTYDTTLDREVPAGSYSYEIQTNVEYDYVYVRMMASADHYASYICQVPVYSMQELTVQISGQGYVAAEERYEYGTEATIVAAPLEGWLFQGWYVENVRVETDTAYTLEMNQAETVTAKFLEIRKQDDNAKLDPDTTQATGFPDATSAEEIVSYYEAMELAAQVINSAGEEFTGKYVGTGCIISVGGWEFTVVISGDVDGNGEVDVYDLRSMLDCLNEETELKDAYYQAACFTGEEEMSIFDIRAAWDYVNGEAETP